MVSEVCEGPSYETNIEMSDVDVSTIPPPNYKPQLCTIPVTHPVTHIMFDIETTGLGNTFKNNRKICTVLLMLQF